MFNPFRKFKNSLTLTKNLSHMLNQVTHAGNLFMADRYSVIEELIILNFYFQRDIIEMIEKTNYQPHNYIYLSNGNKVTVFETMTNISGFFHEVASSLNDSTYYSILEELGNKGEIYHFLNAQLPKNFTKFSFFETSFDSFYYPYKARK